MFYVLIAHKWLCQNVSSLIISATRFYTDSAYLYFFAYPMKFCIDMFSSFMIQWIFCDSHYACIVAVNCRWRMLGISEFLIQVSQP